jgi:hypothetical protein
VSNHRGRAARQTGIAHLLPYRQAGAGRIRIGAASTPLYRPIGIEKARLAEGTMHLPIVGFEVVVAQIVLCRIEDALEHGARFGGKLLPPGRRIEVYFDRPHVRQGGSLSQQQPTSAPNQFGAWIAQGQRPSFGTPMIQLKVILVAEAVASEGVQRVGHAARRGAHGPPEQHRHGRRCIRMAVGDRSQCPPQQHRGAVGVYHVIGERMRDALVGADRLTEGNSLAGISGGHCQRLAREPDECGGSEQLPFLDAGGPDAPGVGTAGDDLTLALGGMEYSDRRAAESRGRGERGRRSLDRHGLSVESQYGLSHRAARNELRFAGLHGVQGHGEHRLSIPDPVDPAQRNVASKFTQDAHRHHRLGKRC